MSLTFANHNFMFNLVFGNTVLAVGASKFAYLCAQYIDIKIYHFWKFVYSHQL